MNLETIPAVAYLIASLCFIFGLKRLSSPRTARSGNIVAGIGMGLALLGTFLLPKMGHFGYILIAIVIGTVPGWLLAKRVKMTAMPQMVSLFNGMGGAQECEHDPGVVFQLVDLGQVICNPVAPPRQP